MVSTSSLKNLQKIENFPFQTLGTFAFDLKVGSKPFSKKVPMTNFECKWFCLAFSEDGFNFVTQKVAI